MNTKSAPRGQTPAIVLEDPKFPRNVGFVLRNAYNFSVKQLWITGDRVGLYGTDTYRLPREERFKEYTMVDVIGHDRPLDRFPRGTAVVGVELIPGAIPLTHFVHPTNAVYVFGPEDGSLSKGMRKRVHQFVFVPTLSCLNLAMVTTAVLYDRLYKAQIAGEVPVRSLEETLRRYTRNREKDLVDVYNTV